MRRALPANDIVTSRAAGLALALLVLCMVPAPTAAAHPDGGAEVASRTLAPDEDLALVAELHYHRIVGHVRSASPGSPLVVLLPEVSDTPIAGPGNDLRVNTLDTCCKGAASTERIILVRNVGDDPADVSVRLRFLHDGFAVMRDMAEPGALEFPVVVLGLATILMLRSLARGRRLAATGARRPRSAAAALGAAWLAGGAFAAYGMARYGGGPIAGTIAATADLPPTGNAFLTTHSFVTLGLMVLWLIAMGAWTVQARQSRDRDLRVVREGWGLAISACLACAAWAIEYDALLAPGVTLVAALALPLGGIVLVRARD